MERDFVEWLARRLPASAAAPLGVSDDAALVAVDGAALVATCDLLVDGVHFLSAEHAPERVGRKAFAVNLSDLAAMAARPVGALVALALPRGERAGDLARRLMEGMLPLAERFGCPIVGGDTNTTSGPLVISVTALGRPTARGVVRRAGARAGDALLVTGSLGGSLAGKHLDFTPRVDEALSLVQRFDLHAMMDLSDGLSLDLARLASASGVGAVVDAATVPVSDEARAAAARDGRAPLDHALSDGEDFELLFAVDPATAERMLAERPLACALARIGEVTAEPGVRLRDFSGNVLPLVARGYEHR